MVDSEMRTNIHDVYAAGDVCTVQWDPWPQMWFQVPTAVCLLYSPSLHLQVRANLKDMLHFVSDASLDSGQTNGCLCSKMYDGSCK